MGWRSILAALALTIVPAIAGAQPAPAASTDAALADIDRLFADFQRTTPTPGLVYGIVADGRLVHVRGFGVQDLVEKRPVTPDTLFRIASMTKAFTALSILSLRDAGKLSLDDPAEKYVPEMRKWRYPTADSPRIRIRDLLSHTAGFVTDDPWGDRQTPLPEAEFTALLKAGVPFSRPPQTAHEYSNFGYALLGRIVANVSRMPYRTYVERTILKPLGMASSGFELAELPQDRRALGYRFEDGKWAPEPEMHHGAFGAMGGLHVSANDYAKWVAFLLSAWPPRDAPDRGPVRRASVRELAQGENFLRTHKRFGSTADSACLLAGAYGKGFRVAQDCELGTLMHHGGGYPGYGSHVLLIPEAGVGIFVFTNRTYTGASGPAWDAALLLRKAGLLVARKPVVSKALDDAHLAVIDMYDEGRVSVPRVGLAMNFLMDRSEASWNAELARMKAQLGHCALQYPLEATGALSGNFRWLCMNGRMEGSILLAPTSPPTIQALRLTPLPPEPR